MKKGCKLVIILLITLLFSGCVKENVEMSIGYDKSMDFSMIIGVDKSFSSSTSESMIGSKENYTKNGFNLESYDDGKYVGYKITKHYDNIDNISSDSNVAVESISDVSNVEKFFTVQKGFLINRYSAKLKNSSTNDINSYSNNNANKDIDSYDTSLNSSSSSLDSSMSQYSQMYSNMMNGSMDLKFILKVPYKTISNNATSIEEDGKKLIWDLATFKGENIEFEFNMFNPIEAIVLLLAGLIVFLLIISAIVKAVKNNKMKKNIEKEIYQKRLIEAEEKANNEVNPNPETINNVENTQIEIPSIDIVNNDQVEMPKTNASNDISIDIQNNDSSSTDINIIDNNK